MLKNGETGKRRRSASITADDVIGVGHSTVTADGVIRVCQYSVGRVMRFVPVSPLSQQIRVKEAHNLTLDRGRLRRQRIG